VADVNPGLPEDPIHLGVEDGGVGVGVAVDPAVLHQPAEVAVGRSHGTSSGRPGCSHGSDAGRHGADWHVVVLLRSRFTDRVSSEPVPLDAVSEWLAAAVPQIPVAGGVSVQRLAGGHSNLTYRLVDAAGTSWVLRRPPTGTALSTAHDMAREWRFSPALAATPVPVPAPVAYCADPGVIGAEFYLMTFVEGDVLDDAGSGHRLDPAVRRTAAFSLVDALAAVHAVDPDAVGLVTCAGAAVRRAATASLAPPCARRLGGDLTAVDVGHARLARWAAALPPSAQQVVHGDFRFGNVAVCPAGIVRAVF
jgi:aminoglycoside phosphotransferase (APT) family kinase protein